MNDPMEQIIDLVRAARELPEGTPAKIGYYEEAIRMADAANLIDEGYEIREMLIHDAVFGGQNDRALVAFTWCLSQFDRDPERFDFFSLMWKFKWIVATLDQFPQISRARIEALVADMRRRYEEYGLSLRPVFHQASSLARGLGDPEAVLSNFAAWEKLPRDMFADCAACEQNFRVLHHDFFDEDELVLVKAQPILAGRMTCAEIPHSTYAWILRALVRLSRLEEAVTYHKRGYRLVMKNRDFLQEVARHIEFLVLTDNLSRAATLFERHLHWALESSEKDKALEFLFASRLFLSRLVATGRATISLKLPASFPLFEASGKYRPAALLEHFEAEIEKLVAQFDRRNGNDFYSRKIVKNRELEALVRPWPLSNTAKSDESGATI